MSRDSQHVVVSANTNDHWTPPRAAQLLSPTSDSGHITDIACAIVRHIYKPTHNYAKAGVMLMDLQPDCTQQLSLSLGAKELINRTRLMQALDDINVRYGKGSLRLASAGTTRKNRQWAMKQERLSPGYTTDWRGIAVAH